MRCHYNIKCQPSEKNDTFFPSWHKLQNSVTEIRLLTGHERWVHNFTPQRQAAMQFAVLKKHLEVISYTIMSRQKRLPVKAQPEFYCQEISKFVARWDKCLKVLRNCAKK